MSDVFGFGEAIEEFDRYIFKATKAKQVVKDVADEMRDLAKDNATVAGLIETGKGVSGIESVHHEGYSEVGWAPRPNFHLYFHERGFHALDNRRKEWKLSRKGRQKGKRGKGARDYKGVSATWVPATPHMRPAFFAKEQEFYKRVQQEITE